MPEKQPAFSFAQDNNREQMSIENTVRFTTSKLQHFIVAGNCRTNHSLSQKKALQSERFSVE